MNEETKTTSVMPLKCPDCQTEWSATFKLPMELGKFTEELGAIKCPKCGGHNARMLPRGDFWKDDKEEFMLWGDQTFTRKELEKINEERRKRNLTEIAWMKT